MRDEADIIAERAAELIGARVPQGRAWRQAHAEAREREAELERGQVAAGQPFPCPNCGETGEWKADYYEGVWQTITLVVGEDGAPEFVDYTGVTGHYDDSTTEDEAYRCSSCSQAITLGNFEMVEPDVAALIVELADFRLEWLEDWGKREYPDDVDRITEQVEKLRARFSR